MARSFALTLVALLATGSAVESRSVDNNGREEQQEQGNQEGRDQAVMMLMQELERYQREIRELRNRVEHLQHRLERMKAAQRERYLDLDTRVNALAEASLQRDSGEGGKAGTSSGDQPDPAMDRKAYEAAKDELLKRDFEAAAEAFRSYLKNFPEGRFRAFAHFWLGEVYRNLSGREEDAIKQFRIVVEQYPKHSKTPAALYKLASLQAGQGNAGEARVTLEKLRMKFPDSREAELAKSMLKQLKADSDG